MKHRFGLLLIGFGVLFILLVWGIASFQHRIDLITPEPLPREIAGLRLTREILGVPALDELS